MKKYDTKKNELWTMCQLSIQMLNHIWRELEKEKMTDEQFALDWLDAINEISIRN